MRHRVVANFEAQAEGVTTDQILLEIRKKVPTRSVARWSPTWTRQAWIVTRLAVNTYRARCRGSTRRNSLFAAKGTKPNEGSPKPIKMRQAFWLVFLFASPHQTSLATERPRDRALRGKQTGETALLAKIR